MAIIGNTIKLKAEFKTFSDVYANPTDITLKIFNKNRKQIGTTIDITDADKISTGIYLYEYTLPYGYNELVYEFAGILEGDIILGRSTILLDWTND